jgi:hypothetical protein
MLEITNMYKMFIYSIILNIILSIIDIVSMHSKRKLNFCPDPKGKLG